jgi:hypothetical protein
MIDKFSIFKGKRRLHFAFLTGLQIFTKVQKQRANKFLNFLVALKKPKLLVLKHENLC